MTNASDDTPRPGEMTDEQLDQLLTAASANLLEHITATTDPNRTLTAIMDRADQQAPAETPVSAMIRLRDAAHDIASFLALAPTSADDIQHAHSLVGTLGGALIPDLAADPVRVLDRIHDLARTRSLVSGLTRELARAFDLALARADQVVRARELAREQVLAGELVGAFASDDATADITRAVNIIGILDHYLGLGLRPGSPLPYHVGNDAFLALDFARALGLSDKARCLDRYLGLGRDVASDIGRAGGIALASALDRARAIAQDLDSHELDVSGEDLSGIEIRHLDALDGITWTRETIWPPAITGDVEEHSYEIQPGVYQVHLGDTRNRHMLLTLA